MPDRLVPACRIPFITILAVACCWCAVLGTASAGAAGTFTVRTCHGSANQSVPTTGGGYGWAYGTIGAWAGYGPQSVDNCAQTDTGFAASDNGLVAINDRSVVRQANSGVGWIYTPAPHTSIAAYKLWMHSSVRVFDGASHGAVMAHTMPLTAYDRTLGWDGVDASSGDQDWYGAPWVEASGKNATAIQVWAICGGPSGVTCPGGAPNAIVASTAIYKAQVTTTDGNAPSATTAGGGVIAHETWHGPQSLELNATDTGSGVYRLLVQRGPDEAHLVTQSQQVLDSNHGACQDENPANGDPYEFTSPLPCATSVSSAIAIDSGGWPDGRQTVRVQVEDAAGNRTTVYGPAVKTVDNLPPAVGAVTVAGPEAREGETLTCSSAVQGESPSLTFRWLRSNADGSATVAIPGAEGPTLVLGPAEIGGKVRCEVTAADAGGQSSGTSGLVDGPFGNGAVVVAYCAGRPTGPRDPCGDLDGDGTVNRLDGDIDGDGAANGIDPDPWDANVRPAVIGAGDGASGAPGAPGKSGDAGPQGSAGTPGPGGGSVTETARVDQNVVPVPNPTTGSGPNGSPADDEAVVVAYFERGSGKRRVVSGTATAGVRERLRIRGTLKTHDGKPISGAKVFLAQKRPDASWKVDGGTVSRADGSLLMFTRKGGVGRQLRLVYFPRDGRDANRGSATLTLKVRQSAALSLSRTRLHNRGALRFTGRVDGTVTRRGPLVQVQVKLPAGWSTFASTRATKARRGRFAVSYRFLRTTRRTVYRFRVRVVPASSSGYVGGTSRARRVVVLP